MTHTHPSRFSIATAKPQRSVALIGMVLLHAGLIVALTNGLENRNSPKPAIVSKTWIIDAPPVTPPTTIDPVTIDSTRPTETVATTPRLEPVPPRGDESIEPTRPIEPTKAQPQTNALPIDRPVRTDSRHPLQQPAYPAQSRRLGEQGTVELALYVLANGQVGDARIERSSGFVRLDDAALREAFRSWRLLPAQVNNAPVASWHPIAITFSLKD